MNVSPPPKYPFLLLAMACLLPSSTIAKEEKDTTSVPQMLIFGEVESLHVVEAKALYESRIDTGATTNSIHAEAIEGFERDGDQWVRFTLVSPATKKKTILERPVSRVAEIKRHGKEPQKRYVVLLKVEFADRNAAFEFSLTDRSKFSYPLLVGRNLLRGNVLVDVSKKHALRKK